MKKAKLLSTGVVPFTLLLLVASPAPGQNRPLDPESLDLQGEIRRLNKNIERIATLLERSVEGQQLELLIQRVEMASSRLSMAEQNLHSTKTSRANLDDEKRELEMRLDQLAGQLDTGDIDMPLEEMERYTQELGLQLRLLNERVHDADRQIIELENEVMNQRDRVRDWQDYIDEKLTSGL